MNETIDDTTGLTGQIKQTGVAPGMGKLTVFKKALTLRGVPELCSQDGKGMRAIAYVKFFNPTGAGTWFVTEWDGRGMCFGWAEIQEGELGYIDLQELAEYPGNDLRIGIEVDEHFLPTKLEDVITHHHL
jgi:hypothetical protein